MPDAAGQAAQRLAAEPPEWLAVLGTAALGGDLGIRRLDEAEWQEVKDPTRYPAQTILIDQLRTADTAVRTGKVLVACGPAVQRRLGGPDVDVEWYADPDEPTRLWCALGPGYPRWLWVPVTPQPDALAEVLGGMFPKPAPQRADFTRHERGFVGYLSDMQLPNVYTGTPEPFNGHDLDRYYTMTPFLEPTSWGSAHVDDPLPEDALEPFSPEWVLAAAPVRKPPRPRGTEGDGGDRQLVQPGLLALRHRAGQRRRPENPESSSVVIFSRSPSASAATIRSPCGPAHSGRY